MEGLGDVVIGSCGKALDDLFFVAVAGEQDDVGVELRELATYAPAKFNARDVGHSPVSDYYARLVFGKQIRGLAAILRT
jgi:hypothetical protein